MKAEQQLAVLTRARELIDRNHCKMAWARTIWGSKVDPTSPWARSFCAMGAISRAEAEQGLKERFISSYHLPVPRRFSALPSNGIGAYNDSHTKEEVLALFDARIAQLRKEIDARPETHTSDVVASRKAVARVPRLAPWPVDDEPRTHRPLVGSVSHRG